MILYGLRRRPLPLAIVAALILVRLIWTPPPERHVGMTMAQCWGVAVAIVVGVSLTSIAIRAVWLAASAARTASRLPRGSHSATLSRAARRTGTHRVVTLETSDQAAFCAGMLRPRVYVSSGLVATLAEEELDAVLLHEAVHARRRDPLRRLLLRAASDMLFYLPLVGRAARLQRERAELTADRVAISRVGAGAVAGALLAVGGGTAPAGTASFDGAAEARVAPLLGDDLPPRRIGAGVVVTSLVGLVVAITLMMCIGQVLWTMFRP
jgi:Zn-dependent protease with chaperone function